jgi:TPR repeat protein
MSARQWRIIVPEYVVEQKRPHNPNTEKPMNRKLFRLIVLLLAAFTFTPSHAFSMDETKALSTLRQKAEQGDAWGQDLLVTLYYFGGAGVKQDYAEAAKWFRLAAMQGFAEAQYFLGREYYGGQAVEQNHAEAAKWFQLAAQQGHADAQFNIGVMYSSGQGVKQDYFEAVKWYRQAAAQGHADAQFNLGIACTNGNGVEKSYALAKDWFRAACNNGNQRGCSQVRILEQKGY